MKYNFDQHIERRGSDSIKWSRHDDDVLPMWVADMDFAAAEPVSRLLRARVEEGIFGYGRSTPELLEVICDRLRRLYDWEVTPDAIVFFPGLVSALNVACLAIGHQGDGVLLQPPVYFPFLDAVTNQRRSQQRAPLTRLVDGGSIYYDVDYDTLEEVISARTRLFLLSNPHNPTGQMYGRYDLERMADICMRHDLIICSDEIHCELLLDSKQHQPIATLSPEIAERCITLMAPSKTFNLAGLSCGFAIVQNHDLRTRLEAAKVGMVPTTGNVMGYVGALAALRDGDEWLGQLLPYLAANRDYLVEYINNHMPAILSTRPQATYLAWLDCNRAGIDGNPREFFLNRAKVALNDGEPFGPGGKGFVRINFACPRSTLTEAVERMRASLDEFS